MSFRQFRALVLSLVLAFSMSAIPLSAAPRDGGGRDRDLTLIEKFIKRVKKLVVGLHDELTLPKP